MAKFGISREGVEALKQLSSDMSSINNDIEECGRTLSATIYRLEENLGVFADQILELVVKVNVEQEKGRESVELLTTKVDQLAEKVEALLGAGL